MAPDLSCYTTPGNDLWRCVVDDATAALGGEATFGLIVGFVALFAMWWANDRRLGTPAVVILVSGSMLIPLLPAEFAQVARSIAFLGLVAAVVAVGQRYFLDPNI